MFEKICLTPEYYITRTETEILKEHSAQIADKCASVNVIVELGSGSSIKTRYILEAFLKKGNLIYVPIDVSKILIESGRLLIEKYSTLNVNAILGEYEPSLLLASELFKEPKLVIFLGSSIGNFDLPKAAEFMQIIGKNINKGDFLLIGFDMVKDTGILNAAYNDSELITAEFNLNILKRINRELGADFNLNKFSHRAFFNENKSRVEMHLVSDCMQSVKICEKEIQFNTGESIHTENSYKFTDEMINSLAKESSLLIHDKWSDKNKWFSIYLFTK